MIKSMVGKLALNLLENSSSSEDTDEELELVVLEAGQRHGRIDGYVENVVPLYSVDDYRSHFRMSRAAVEDLCLELHQPYLDIVGRPRIPLLKCVLLTLWTLGNQESFRGIGDRFGFLKGHTHVLFIQTCKLIVLRLKETFIKFPSTLHEFRELARYFNVLRGNRSFQNVIGVIDAMHISIPGPVNDNSFYDRKGNHSMIVQGICDHRLKFLDIFAGWPGSSHDARVWQNSPIYEQIAQRGTVPAEYHILGDTAYPLRTFMIVPFKDNGHLTEQQRRFNVKLSSSRVVIEQAWGRLVGIFRRLRYLQINNREYFKYIVLAACILHNFIIQQNDYNYAQEVADGMAQINDNILQHEDYVGEREDGTGAEKRNNLMQLMH